MKIDLFSIPLWRYELPNYSQYKDLILSGVNKIRAVDAGGKFSNCNGYQSSLLSENAHLPEFNPIFSYIEANCLDQILNDVNISIKNYDVAAWVNVNNRRSAINKLHNHLMVGGDILFSGVFYVNAPPKSGNIDFKNSLLNNFWPGLKYTSKSNQYTSHMFSAEPTEGSILIWPSFVWHMVEPNDHEEERISIAFDIFTK